MNLFQESASERRVSLMASKTSEEVVSMAMMGVCWREERYVWR